MKLISLHNIKQSFERRQIVKLQIDDIYKPLWEIEMLIDSPIASHILLLIHDQIIEEPK